MWVCGCVGVGEGVGEGVSVCGWVGVQSYNDDGTLMHIRSNTTQETDTYEMEINPLITSESDPLAVVNQQFQCSLLKA